MIFGFYLGNYSFPFRSYLYCFVKQFKIPSELNNLTEKLIIFFNFIFKCTRQKIFHEIGILE